MNDCPASPQLTPLTAQGDIGEPVTQTLSHNTAPPSLEAAITAQLADIMAQIEAALADTAAPRVTPERLTLRVNLSDSAAYLGRLARLWAWRQNENRTHSEKK